MLNKCKVSWFCHDFNNLNCFTKVNSWWKKLKGFISTATSNARSHWCIMWRKKVKSSVVKLLQPAALITWVHASHFDLANLKRVRLCDTAMIHLCLLKWLLLPLRVDTLGGRDCITEIECEHTVWRRPPLFTVWTSVIPHSVNDGRVVLVRLMRWLCVWTPLPQLTQPSAYASPHDGLGGPPPVSDPVVRRGACEAS